MNPSILFVDHASDVGGAELSLFDTAMHWNSPLHVALLQTGPFADLLRANAVPATVVEAGAAVLGVRRGGGWHQGLRAPPVSRHWRSNSPGWPGTMTSSTPTRRSR